MKSLKKTLIVLGALMMVATAAWAVDYSKMSNDELSSYRGQLYNATQDEWHAFHTEWWKRLSEMGPQEREKYMGPGMMKRVMGQGYGMGQGMGQNMGKGMGKGRGYGHHGCYRPCWNNTNGPATPPAAQQ
nr:DUF1104 domain-containing protein [uncultured Desulfobulbus sp.]